MHKFLNYLNTYCNFKPLPIFKKEFYVYRNEKFILEKKFEVEISDEVKEIGDLPVDIYGWVVEIRFKKIVPSSGPVASIGKVYYSQWINHWNHKIYNSKEIALDAINQFKSSDIEYRVIPLYKIKDESFRNYVIDKILKQ